MNLKRGPAGHEVESSELELGKLYAEGCGSGESRLHSSSDVGGAELLSPVPSLPHTTIFSHYEILLNHIHSKVHRAKKN